MLRHYVSPNHDNWDEQLDMAEFAFNDAWQKAYADEGAAIVVMGIAESVYASQTLHLVIELQDIGSYFCQSAHGTHPTCTYLARHELESAPIIILIVIVIVRTFSADGMHGLCRHTEDMDLHSVNYLHYGAPKVWYCIPPSDRQKMDAFVAKKLYAQHGRCREFMRHKVESDCTFCMLLCASRNIKWPCVHICIHASLLYSFTAFLQNRTLKLGMCILVSCCSVHVQTPQTHLTGYASASQAGTHTLLHCCLHCLMQPRCVADGADQARDAGGSWHCSAEGGPAPGRLHHQLPW